MAMSIETEPSEVTKAVLRELHELIDYLEADDKQDGLIASALVTGNLNKNTPDVPTLTSVAPELADESKALQSPKQQGLFSSRMEHLKQQMDGIDPIPDPPEIIIDQARNAAAKDDPLSSEEISELVDSIVNEYMPEIEAQLRARATAYILKNKH